MRKTILLVLLSLMMAFMLPASLQVYAKGTTTATEVKYPTKDELFAKVFTEKIEATLTGKNGEGSFTQSDTLPDFLMTQDMIDAYDEKTGTLTMTMTDANGTTTSTLKFTYDKKGKIVYNGTIKADAPQYTAEGTLSGAMK